MVPEKNVKNTTITKKACISELIQQQCLIPSNLTKKVVKKTIPAIAKKYNIRDGRV